MLDNIEKFDKILLDHLLTDKKINISLIGALSEKPILSNILKIESLIKAI